MILSCICIGLAVAGFGLIVWLIMTSPMGYEDEDGFHYGEPPKKD